MHRSKWYGAGWVLLLWAIMALAEPLVEAIFR